jgi:hypothetical protein
MSSIPEPHDPRFDAAEADVDRGEPWKFREANAPNPLTILATEWSTGVTKLGEAEFLNGVDRAGKRWSVLVGGVVLTKRLIEGLVEEWDDATKDFVVVETEGRVQPGEVVSIKYLGDKKGAQYDYPNFYVSRKPPTTEGSESQPAPEPPAEPEPGKEADDDFPF